MPVIDIIQIRHGSAATWTSVNPVLALGELGLETDTRLMKEGDGTTAWNSLLYVSVVPGGSLGTPSAGTLTNCTGLPESGVVSLSSDLTAIASSLALKAPLASPTFSGELALESLKFSTLPPVYANNAAAVAGGLTAGKVYRTGGDPDTVCIVH